MGLVKKLKKTIKKTTSRIVKSAAAVVKAPTSVIKDVAQGDFSGATKDFGRGVGGLANFSTLGVLESGTARKALRSKTLNFVTLGSAKEVDKVGRGFRDLQKTGQADKSFYQSGLSLAGKGAVIMAAPSLYAAGKSAVTGVKAGTVVKGAVVAGYLSKGNVSGALQKAGVPGDVAALASDLNKAPSGGGGPYWNSDSDGDGYSDGGTETEQSVSPMFLAIGSLAALYLIKK